MCIDKGIVPPEPTEIINSQERILRRLLKGALTRITFPPKEQGKQPRSSGDHSDNVPSCPAASHPPHAVQAEADPAACPRTNKPNEPHSYARGCMSRTVSSV